MMRINIFFMLLLVLCLTLTCRHSVEPPPNDCTPPLPTETTSHNFIWRLDTLGVGNGSVLNDVFIIDENNVWAVGEIYLEDSAGQLDPHAYNAARWDGVTWSLLRIPVRDYGGFTGSFPLKAVYGFGVNDVWFASDADLIQWNGSSFTGKAFFITSIPFNGQVVKMWGTSDSNIYCVGRNGTIYSYNGGSWTKLNSGTTIDIQDIWGGVNCRGETEILAVASYGTQVPQAKKLLRINGTTVSEVSSAGLPLALSSVWFVPQQKYYAGGDLLYFTNAIGNSWQQEPNQPLYYVSRIRGTALNDIAVCGGFGHLSHFNGATWKHYMGTELPRLDGNYLSAALRGNTLVAVGEILGGKAVVTIGRR